MALDRHAALRPRPRARPQRPDHRRRPGRDAQPRSGGRRAGYHRYWLAEHHNMPAVAATNPPLLIAMVAAATSRIRVGSGGVMLPNHAPLVVAEQFALLEAALPGPDRPRHRPGPGHRPGDELALRHGAGGVEDDAVVAVPGVRRQRDLDDEPRRRRAPGAGPDARAERDAARRLGADRSGCSAPRTTRRGSRPRRGLPYVFAHHFSGQRHRRGARALPLAASARREALAEPRDLPDRQRRAWPRPRRRPSGSRCPQLQAMVALRTGGQLRPQRLVEEAERRPGPRRAPAAGRGDAPPLGASAPRSRPPSRSASWPRRTTSTR